jgi:hypothetical protein
MEACGPSRRTTPREDRGNVTASRISRRDRNADEAAGAQSCEKLREAGLGPKRFMFTDTESISPDAPAKILEQIFVTPKDSELGTLYSLCG